jgi:hypothetical protein
MKRFVVVGLALVTSIMLAGCDGDAPDKTTVPPTPVQRDQGNVNRVCDYFHARAIETLAAPAAKATVTDLVNQPGIPSQLRSTALIYFEMNDKAGAYKNVITRCQSEGWTP